MEEKKCNQNNCSKKAAYRYTWPGRDEAHICEEHGRYSVKVAEAIGMHLQLVPLDQPASEKGE